MSAVSEKSDDDTTMMQAADDELLQDEILFKQPQSTHMGDCPICCLPLPIDPQKSTMTCCSKVICSGCYHANRKREAEMRLQHKCAFCRKDAPKTYDEINERLMKRNEANDPVALFSVGTTKCSEGDYKAGFKCFTKAAALGDANAHYQLSCLYRNGKGVEKDLKRELHHLKEAAIGGHPAARHNLGCVEMENGQYDRAAKHFIIAAKHGFDASLNCVMHQCVDGHVSKEDVDATLIGHKAAIDATQSHERDLAEVYEMRLAKRDRSGI